MGTVPWRYIRKDGTAVCKLFDGDGTEREITEKQKRKSCANFAAWLLFCIAFYIFQVVRIDLGIKTYVVCVV